MLKLNLSPIRSDEDQLPASWQAPILTIGTTDYDLSLLPDGATAQHPVLGTVSRTGNDYEGTIKLPHGPNAPESTRFPVPLEITVDGVITLPIYDIIEEEPVDELA